MCAPLFLFLSYCLFTCIFFSCVGVYVFYTRTCKERHTRVRVCVCVCRYVRLFSNVVFASFFSLMFFFLVLFSFSESPCLARDVASLFVFSHKPPRAFLALVFLSTAECIRRSASLPCARAWDGGMWVPFSMHG